MPSTDATTARPYYSQDMTREYLLVPADLGGGEGHLYDIVDSPGDVAKIYGEDALNREIRFSGSDVEDGGVLKSWRMQEKISYMTAIATRQLAVVRECGEDVLAVAWPRTPLYDAQGRFAGFVMPRLGATASGDAEVVPDLHCAYRPRDRRYLFGDDFTWLTSIKIALNLSTVVRHLHENEVVIGDFNCSNILVDRDAHVMLIDADSFCVTNHIRQATYRCFVGCGEYVAPEMQGRRFDRSQQTFTKESDCFALAIHVFMLLMNGTHPFTGVSAGAGSSRQSSTAEPLLESILNGSYVFSPGLVGRIPAGTLPIDAVPQYIRDMFERTFVYDAEEAARSETIGRRPTAAEWEGVLRRLYDECKNQQVGCPLDRRHVNMAGRRTCAWCQLEGKGTDVPLMPVDMLDAMEARQRDSDANVRQPEAVYTVPQPQQAVPQQAQAVATGTSQATVAPAKDASQGWGYGDSYLGASQTRPRKAKKPMSSVAIIAVVASVVAVALAVAVVVLHVGSSPNGGGGGSDSGQVAAATADLSGAAFALGSKSYVLGESTVQDLLDGGWEISSFERPEDGGDILVHAQGLDVISMTAPDGMLFAVTCENLGDTEMRCEECPVVTLTVITLSTGVSASSDLEIAGAKPIGMSTDEALAAYGEFHVESDGTTDGTWYDFATPEGDVALTLYVDASGHVDSLTFTRFGGLRG